MTIVSEPLPTRTLHRISSAVFRLVERKHRLVGVSLILLALLAGIAYVLLLGDGSAFSTSVSISPWPSTWPFGTYSPTMGYPTTMFSPAGRFFSRPGSGWD